MNVDITVLSRVVRRLDISATMKAFAAVLAPLFVLANLTVIFVGVKGLLVDDLDFSENWGFLLAFAALAFLVTVAPLTFILVDWAARKDAWRHLSAITGAILGAIGFILVGVALVAGVTAMQEAGTSIFHGSARRDVVVIGTALLVLAGTWVVATSRWLRVLVGGIVVLALVLAVGAIGVALATMLREEWSTGEMEVGQAVEVVAILPLPGFVVWWLVRAVRLRIVLSGNRPRALLLGDLHRRGFWVRMAFLIGLPSSLWHRRALRTGAFWAFLVSRPLVYLGFLALSPRVPTLLGIVLFLAAGLLLIVGGHFAFFAGKRLAARTIWAPEDRSDPRPPVLFLRSFEDDQFDFRSNKWNLIGRWFDLWSFRRNADEALIDEIAQYGPVVALGRPGEKHVPFGAQRYYAAHENWQELVTATARRAQAIVMCAGDSPGVRWEYELLTREKLLDRTLLLFRPSADGDAANRRALEAFHQASATAPIETGTEPAPLVALLPIDGRPTLLSARRRTPASYVVALRGFFQKCRAHELADPADGFA